jgi:hypothetical protein
MRDVMGGSTVSRDPGGGKVQTRDFDLHADDGKVIAVEVTRHLKADHMQWLAEVDRQT